MKNPVVFASATGFLLMLGLGVLFPVLPFLTRELGLSDSQAGLLLGAYPLVGFVVSPLWGRFSEVRGRRLAIAIGLLGFSAGFALFGLGRTFGELLAARVIGGLFSAAALPALFAYVADVTTPERRSASMGALGAGIALGVTLGPALGYVAFALYGLRAPYFFAAGLGVVNALAVWLRLPEPERRGAAPARRGSRALVGALAPLLFASFLTATARIALDSTLAFFLADRLGATPRGVAALLVGMGVAAVLVQGGLVRRLSGKVPDERIFLAGALCMAAGLAAIGAMRSWGGVAAAGLPIAMGWALVSPSLSALVARGAEHDQGEAAGWNNSMQSLARVAAPFAFTSGLWPSFGGVVTFAVAGLLCLLAAALSVLRLRSQAAA